MRRLHALLSLSIALTVCASVVADDRDGLLGTWRIDVFEDDGRDRLERLAAGPPRKPGGEPRVAHLVVAKDGCWVIRGDGRRELKAGLANAAWESMVLDESTDPKSIDIRGFAGKDGKTTKTYAGLYSLDGKSLVICWNEQGKQRPSKLESDGANNLFRCSKISDEPRKPAVLEPTGTGTER